MTDNNPITPPPELVQEWINKHYGGKVHRELGGVERTIATQATQWGYEQRGAVNEAELQKARNQELEACCEWLVANDWAVPGGECLRDLRAARRPEPKGQAEKALASLDGVALPEEAWQAVSAALERLRKLEEGND